MATANNPRYLTVKDRLRQFRRHLGLSQKELGERLGIDQTAISCLEVGKYDLTLKMLFQLVELDCSPNWLLFNEGPMSYAQANQSGATVEVRDYSDSTEYIVRIKKKTSMPPIEIVTMPADEFRKLMADYVAVTRELIETKRELETLKDDQYVGWKWVCQYFDMDEKTARLMLQGERILVHNSKIKKFRKSDLLRFAERHSVKLSSLKKT